MTGTSTRSVPARSGPRPRSSTSRPALGSPLFVLNLKSYPTAVGDAALRLGRILARLGRASRVSVAIAPAPADLARLADSLPIPVLSQHTDPFDPGPHTGYLVAGALRRSGVRGSLVNHSEHPLPAEAIRAVLDRLRAEHLVPLVCARDVGDAEALARLRPPYLVVEPPELIGGNRSVSTARPEVISGSVAAVGRVSSRTRVLCGAGVHTREDVARALELGSEGILLASAVALSPRPESAIREILAGFRPRGVRPSGRRGIARRETVSSSSA